MYTNLPESAANAVTSWIAANAKYSTKYKIEDLTVTFKATASYGVFGIISTAVGIGALFLPHMLAKYILSGIFGILGILIILYGYVMYVKLDPEYIIYRGPLGLKKELLWRDVKSVTVVSEQGDILVSSRNVRIRIFAYLAGFSELKELVSLRFDEAYSAQAAIAADDDSLFRKEVGGTTFRMKKVAAFVGLSLVVVSLPAAVYGIPLGNFKDVMGVICVIVFLVLGLLMMLYGFVTRLTVDDDKLVYRTLFWRDKEMRWEDIQSVVVCGEPQHELLKVTSADTKIKIRIDFKGYHLIKSLVQQRCSDRVQKAAP